MTDRRNDTLPGPDLLRAGLEFAKLRLWESMEPDEAMAFVVPGEAHPVFGVVMGQMGQEFGLTLSGGPHGAWTLQEMLNAEDEDEDFFASLSVWGITLTRVSDLPAPLRKALKASPVTLPRGAKVPLAIVMEAGRAVRGPNAREEKVFLYCLNGLIKAVGRDGFHEHLDQLVAGEVVGLGGVVARDAVPQSRLDQPLHVAQRQLEVTGDRRQRHVDGDVERRERGAQPDDRQAQERAAGQRCLPRNVIMRSHACLAAAAL